MNRTTALAAAGLWLAASVACSSEPPRQSADILAEVLAEAVSRNAESPSLPGLPATFIGVLPCADCPGRRHHLNLFADRSFALREVHLGDEGRAADDRGTWILEADRRTLRLTSASRSIRMFRIVDDQTLRQLGAGGRDAAQDAPHALVRSPRFEALAPLPAPAGSDPDAARPTVAGTAWRLVRLGSAGVDAATRPSAPLLELRLDDETFTASDGCNRVVGSYRRSGGALTFTVGAVTRTTCAGLADLTTRYTDALRATRSWRLVSNELQLLDEGGRVLARFAPPR